MNTTSPKRKKAPLPVAVFLSILLTVPVLSSCGGGGSQTAAPPPPVDSTVSRNVNNPAPTPTETKRGLNTGQKVAITLAGAAALYYLYNRYKNSQGAGAKGKYYLSKNGRVYYRDEQNRPVWVTPPPEGIRVPESEAQQYRDFQGYNGRETGRTLRDVAPANAPI
ncbi:hypothetical protein [Iningainema tapete]|uniref:Uncharacterized protein n=1 Tax=Iningainema tapete BLCC-T55 TaxID=2748662 RepID=A0A8J6XFH8_9CYAN|nr:hypothetical protein [Iningainema tapete]MBD2774759.1 hypothetical protein [Iningainema tapete BLCC-T55]